MSGRWAQCPSKDWGFNGPCLDLDAAPCKGWNSRFRAEGTRYFTFKIRRLGQYLVVSLNMGTSI